VNILSTNDHFGELALLHDEPRNATICAQTDVRALKISREDFAKYGLAEKVKSPELPKTKKTEKLSEKFSLHVPVPRLIAA